jgi:hypothetical protein
MNGENVGFENCAKGLFIMPPGYAMGYAGIKSEKRSVCNRREESSRAAWK